MTLVKLAVSIGNVRVDSCCRCEDSRSSSGEVAVDMPLTRIWFKELPMNNKEPAVACVTKAGNNSLII